MTGEALKAVREERLRILDIIADRRNDMSMCNKHDDCRVRADALDGIIEDIIYNSPADTEYTRFGPSY